MAEIGADDMRYRGEDIPNFGETRKVEYHFTEKGIHVYYETVFGFRAWLHLSPEELADISTQYALYLEKLAAKRATRKLRKEKSKNET